MPWLAVKSDGRSLLPGPRRSPTGPWSPGFTGASRLRPHLPAGWSALTSPGPTGRPDRRRSARSPVVGVADAEEGRHGRGGPARLGRDDAPGVPRVLLRRLQTRAGRPHLRRRAGTGSGTGSFPGRRPGAGSRASFSGVGRTGRGDLVAGEEFVAGLAGPIPVGARELLVVPLLARRRLRRRCSSSSAGAPPGRRVGVVGEDDAPPGLGQVLRVGSFRCAQELPGRPHVPGPELAHLHRIDPLALGEPRPRPRAGGAAGGRPQKRHRSR